MFVKYGDNKIYSHVIDFNIVSFMDIIHLKYDDDRNDNHKTVKIVIFPFT